MRFISRSIRDGKHLCQTISPLCNIRGREHFKSTQNNGKFIASHTTIESAKRHMASRLSLPAGWVKPLVVLPCCKPHKQTLIILHGRGDWAENFALALLQVPFHLSSSQQTGNSDSLASSFEQTETQSSQPDSAITVRDALPHTKFVFLTAPMRSCTMMNGQKNRQWFDNLSLADPETRQDLQIEGLRETTNVLSQLINEEIQESVALEKNVKIGLMGFSQGAAASLIAGLVLGFENESLGPLKEGTPVAVVSMSGWLPFRGLLDTREGKGGSTIISGVDNSSSQVEHLYRMIRSDRHGPFVRSSNGYDRNTDVTATPSSRSIPAMSFLLCHGKGDDHVSSDLSRVAAASLQKLGIADVISKEYDGLGHFVNGQEIGDAIDFLRKRFGETEVAREES